jgi:hypothetical protein
MLIPLNSILSWDTNSKTLSAVCCNPIKWDLLYDKLAAVNECRWATGGVPWEQCLISDLESPRPRVKGRFVRFVYIKMPRTPHSYLGQIMLSRWMYKCHIARRRLHSCDCRKTVSPLLELVFGFVGALAGLIVDLVHPNVGVD